MKYAAIMFDVVDSRRYLDRYDIQNLLMRSVEYLNDVYKNAIKKEVVSSAGDEFQGLFLDLSSAFLYIRKLQLLIYPIKVRCGIGYGEIKYDKAEWMSSAFDGEAYYLARDAINSINKKKSNAICFNTMSKFDRYLNTFCMASMEIKSKQSQIAHLIELIADIISPICPVSEHLDFYDFVLANRIRVIQQEQWNRVSARYRDDDLLNINLNYVFEARYLAEENDDYESAFLMEDFWVRGMSTIIAQAMNTTRQNIDRYVSLGKIKESRTMDKAIYEMLGERQCLTLHY